MSRPASIATRLTLLFALVSSVVLLALGGLVVSALERHFRQQDIDLLEGKILLIRALVGQAGSDAALPALAGPLHDAFVGHHDLTVRVARADGHLIFANAPLTVPEAAHQPIEWRSGGHHFRALSTTIASDTPARAPVEVTVAIDINHHTAFIDRFSATLGVFILAAALVSALLGGWAVRRGLAPLRLMKARAAAVTATRLDPDGGNIAAVLATLEHIRQDTADIRRIVSEAFDGASLVIPIPEVQASFSVVWQDLPYRQFTQQELSDGTLQFVALCAALLSYHLPRLVVLNEPENSLHPSLMPALARLVGIAAENSQVIIVTHSQELATALEEQLAVQVRSVEKQEGETQLAGLTLLGTFKDTD